MQSAAVVALALLESVSAFQAPAAAMRSVSRASATMFSEGDLGVLPPLGVFDPLGLIETRDMRRYEIMEIKHGRAAMLGFLHVIAIEAGIRVPGYLSTSQNLKFSDVPAGCFASLEAIPTFGWLQIMAFTCAAETGFSATPWAVTKQTDDKAPGDIGGANWVRYDDEGEKAYKLNVERQNGRGAMMGITGCLIHELLGAHDGSKRGWPGRAVWLGCRAPGPWGGWGLGPLPALCLRRWGWRTKCRATICYSAPVGGHPPRFPACV